MAAIGAFAVAGINNNNNNNENWNDYDDDDDADDDGMSASLAVPPPPPTSAVEVEAYVVAEDEETGHSGTADLEQRIIDISRDLATLRAQNAAILERQIVQAVGVEIDTNPSSSNDPQSLASHPPAVAPPPEQSRLDLKLPDDPSKKGWLCCCCCCGLTRYLALSGATVYFGLAAAAATVLVLVTVVVVIVVTINPSKPPVTATDTAEFTDSPWPFSTTTPTYPLNSLLPKPTVATTTVTLTYNQTKDPVVGVFNDSEITNECQGNANCQVIRGISVIADFRDVALEDYKFPGHMDSAIRNEAELRGVLDDMSEHW